MIEYKYFDCEITQWDINNGIKNDNDRCPMSLACKRFFNKKLNFIDKVLYNYTLILEFSPEAHKFVYDFDNNFDVKPVIVKICYIETIYKPLSIEYLRSKQVTNEKN